MMPAFDFVASPFSHPAIEVEARRYRAAVHFVAWAARERMVVVSPRVPAVAPARAPALPPAPGVWLHAHMAFLRMARSLIVLRIDGWDASRGVREEILEAHRLRLPLAFYERHGDAAWRVQIAFDAGGWSP